MTFTPEPFTLGRLESILIAIGLLPSDEALAPEDTPKGLDFDSLDLVEIVMAIEEDIGSNIDEGNLAFSLEMPFSELVERVNGQLGRQPAERWSIHISGSDEYHAKACAAAAHQSAREFNEWFSRQPKTENSPHMHATVQPWPFDAASHAAALGNEAGATGVVSGDGKRPDGNLIKAVPPPAVAGVQAAGETPAPLDAGGTPAPLLSPPAHSPLPSDGSGPVEEVMKATAKAFAKAISPHLHRAGGESFHLGEAKPTPPPWKAMKGSEEDLDRWIVVADGDMNWLIATIENGQPGDIMDTEGATAYLLAAAPELLTVAEDGLPLIDDLVQDAREKAKNHARPEFRAKWDHVASLLQEHADATRAAIAKAKGGAA